jgi:hypothetical protein
LRQGSAGSFFGSGGYGASLIGGSAIAASGAAGDDVHIAAGAGDLGGDGGWASVIAGNSGVTPGAVAGSVYVAAGSNTGSQDADDQGAVDILAGNAGALIFKPGRVFLKASDDTVLGTGSSITVGPPDGSVPAAGSVSISGGNGLLANGGGSITLTSGSSATGTPGDVNLRAKDGTVAIRTQQTGFVGTDRVTQTYGVQTSVPAGTVIAVLGTLDTDGRNMKITVDASGVNVADNTDHLSAYIVQTFYRAGGTVSALTAHVDDNQDTGAWPNGVSPLFALVINGNDIELQWTWNGIQAAAVTANIAVTWVRQEGGFAS